MDSIRRSLYGAMMRAIEVARGANFDPARLLSVSVACLTQEERERFDAMLAGASAAARTTDAERRELLAVADEIRERSAR